MKWFFSIWVVLWLPAQLHAQGRSPLPATNEVDLDIGFASYDTPTNVFYAGAIATYIAGMYPQFTNGVWTWSHSGAGLELSFEADEAPWLMPLLHSVDTNLVAWDLFLAGGDNGDLSSNQVIQWTTNVMVGPQFVWNGTALTNEGISFPLTLHIPVGGPPGDSLDGGVGSADIRNNACTNLAASSNLVQMDSWHDLMTNGVSADLVKPSTNRLFGFKTGAHPYPAGFLCMALQQLLEMHAETNVGSCVIDFNAATVRSTNHMTLSGVSVSGGVLTWTNHFDRMPGAWRVGGDQWGCDNAFVLMPYLADAFQWTISITNCPVGNYRLDIDGSNVVTLTSTQLAKWNMFAVTNGPLWAQRMALWNVKLDQQGLDHDTMLPLHDAGTRGVGGNYDFINYLSQTEIYPDTDRGTNFINAVAPFVAGIKAFDVQLHNAAQQTNHVFSVTFIPSDGIPLF